MDSMQSEVLTLYPRDDIHWPDYQNYCQVPAWMHGHWEHMYINQQIITYKDHSSFKTYTMKCIQDVHGPSKSALVEKKEQIKFKAFSRTQCGEEQYHCIWTIKRSENILEFQIGSKTVQNISAALNTEDDICDEKYFDETRWFTQARLDPNLTQSPCPVDGEFDGLLPDAQGLCAKLSSECESPDIMHYQVSACEYDEIIEGMYASTTQIEQINNTVTRIRLKIYLFSTCRT